MTKVEIRRIESINNVDMISSVSFKICMGGETLYVPSVTALADLRDMLDAYVNRDEIVDELEVEMEEGEGCC